MAVLQSPSTVERPLRSASPSAALSVSAGSSDSGSMASEAASESLIASPPGEPTVNVSQPVPAGQPGEATTHPAVADLQAQIQKIHEQLEFERGQRMMAQRALGPGGMSSRPWLYEWDMFRPETYSDRSNQSYYLDRVTDPITTDVAQLHERRKVMMGIVEAELKWMKNEDDAYSTVIKEKQDLKTENTQLTERLNMLEASVRQWNPSLLPAEKDPKQGRGKPLNRATEAAADDDDDDDDASQGSSEWATAKLNRVEWASFSTPYHQAKETFAIDVLEGEPVISFMSYYRPWWTMNKSVPQEKKAPAATKKRLYPPGQGPMPERIRINSRHILKILQKLDPEHFTDEDEMLVMIRPFKALVLFEEQIRQIHTVLVEKHRGNKSEPADPEEEQKTAEKEENPSPPSSPTSAATPEESQEGEGNPVNEVLKDEFTSSETALDQLQVLVDFLDHDLKAKMDYVRSDQCHRVSYDDVWYLFRPGDEVVDQGGKQAYRIIGVTSSPHKVTSPYRNWETSSKDEPTVMLQCAHVDFDGKFLGPVLQTFRIARFDGEKAITSLRVFPLRLAGTRAGNLASTVDVRQQLIDRGKMFIKVLAKKHMHYSGLTLETRDEVDGQVVIDFEKAFESEDKAKPIAELGQNHGEEGEEELEKVWRPKIKSLISIEVPDSSDSDCTAACCARDRVHKDMYAEHKRNEHYRNSLIPEELGQQPSVAIYPRAKDSPSSNDALSDDDYVIMSFRVFGFSLRSRKWEKLDLTHLSYIRGIRVESQDGDQGKPQVRETAFDQLVLEEGHKKMLLSLVAQHYRDKESPTAANEQVDIVRGKGKGLIILLHGAPGVGKTTTAEGVAELFEKPLFQITCGDLGTTAESVENALETNFALAHRWGCILLLDEADVFLAKRTPQDFKRNGLVSVFLRVLEYYAGILFLTTNRIGDFDEAFGSRIHISLHYPQLTLPATREIFLLNMRLIQQRFTEKKRNITIDRDAILAHVEKYWKTHKKMRWNGRQIRNACQTALALAEFEAGGGSHEKIIDPTAEVRLSVTHLETVSKAYFEFMQYLKKLYKVDQDRLAQRRGVRARELDDKKMNFTDDEDHSDLEDPGDVWSVEKKRSVPGTPTPGLLSPSGLSQTLTLNSPPTPMSPFNGLSSSMQESIPPPPLTSPPSFPGYPAQPPGYPQAFPPGWPQTAAQPGFGYGQQLGGITPNQQPQPQVQQMAQMWQNMNPTMWQQAMLQGQMPPLAGMGPGMGQQPPPGGPGNEKQ